MLTQLIKLKALCGTILVTLPLKCEDPKTLAVHRIELCGINDQLQRLDQIMTGACSHLPDFHCFFTSIPKTPRGKSQVNLPHMLPDSGSICIEVDSRNHQIPLSCLQGGFNEASFHMKSDQGGCGGRLQSPHTPATMGLPPTPWTLHPEPRTLHPEP